MNKLHILTTYDQINQLRTYLQSEKQHVQSVCAFDTEANGRKPHTSKVIGWSISIYDDEGFYIPFETWTDDDGLCVEAPAPIPKEGQNTTGTLYEAISPKSKQLAIEMIKDLLAWRTIMHNAPYDVIIVDRNYGIDLADTIYSDTMLKKHTVDSDKPHGLKECGVKYIGEGANDEQLDLAQSVVRNGGKWNKQDKWIWRGDIKYVGKYAAKDTVLTLLLERALDNPLNELGLRDFYYTDLVIPLLKTSTIPMQRLGFPVDKEYFKKAKLDLQWEIKDLQLQIYNEIKDDIIDLEQAVLDRDYPIRPGGRFGQTLIEYVGLDIPTHPKTGVFSTAKGVIDQWKPQALKEATADQIRVIWFVTGECDKVPPELFKAVQVSMFQEDNPEDYSPVNLNSGPQFAEVVYKKWKIESPKKSKKTGQASFDAEVIENIAKERIEAQYSLSPAEAQDKFDELMEAERLPKDADWFVKYLRVRKLEKLLSNYVEGILDLQVNSVVYTSMQQHGTTSGRYASSEPNMQNLPAHSELGKLVKRGFIAEVK